MQRPSREATRQATWIALVIALLTAATEAIRLLQ